MDLRFNTHRPTVAQVVLGQTNLSWTARLFSNSHVQDTAFGAVKANDANETAAEKAVLSASLETAGNASYQLRGTLTTDTPYLSPVVDVSQIGATLVSNIVNNDATGETAPGGGNALTRYVTKQTTLTANQDAEDLHVFLTAYLPSSASISVFAKMVNFEDSDAFDIHSWVELTATATAVSDKNNKADFKEMEYTLPTSVLSGPNGEYRYTNSAGVLFTGYRTFSVKLVLLAADNSIIPFAKNLRVVCLQK
jgi:hypothetical protein